MRFSRISQTYLIGFDSEKTCGQSMRKYSIYKDNLPKSVPRIVIIIVLGEVPLYQHKYKWLNQAYCFFETKLSCTSWVNIQINADISTEFDHTHTIDLPNMSFLWI
ncbi:hypothetical protein TNIN_223061 [Trichonephila inaurata madagascariensis]|uniref:Uncharacterized protein n=1 Tax=Trichonephila inaurata madagascariensis TaxID=2747483 RepID=A0A8X6X0U4_9ARAC|nr:hypothetical protein TNIN_223061 [Trichonephila inaurata madagascariensis]